jgi:hypothetical protein
MEGRFATAQVRSTERFSAVENRRSVRRRLLLRERNKIGTYVRFGFLPLTPMSRLLIASLLVTATVCAAAEESAASALAASPDRGNVPRVISPEMVARLAATTPKFVPPPAPGTEAAPAPEPREPDRPLNQIIRLPRYIVAEPRIAPTKERHVLTYKGKLAIALKKHPGLKFGPFAWLNNAIALEMYEEDLKAERRKEEAELWSLYSIVPTGEGERVKTP